jgi:hypothetical protein
LLEGVFTISLWFTKIECVTDRAYEYLYSHHEDNGGRTWDTSYIDIYLSCEEEGGGFSTVEGSILRYWLRDTAGSEAAIDYSLHDAGAFDAITSVWVNTILTVSPGALVTYDDGMLVPDDAYGFYTGVQANTAASPNAPGRLSPPFAGANGQPAFNLLAHTSYGAEIFIGARCDVGSG